MNTPGNGSNTLLNFLIGIVVAPILILLIPLALVVVESHLFGTHHIDNALTRIHLDDVYLWIYHCF